MPSTIADGRAKFGCSITDFYRRDQVALRIARRGILVPPISEVAVEAEPALARVNPLDGVARWIADCPDCRGGAEYVWLGTPLLFCASCGNREIGGRWRPVRIPAERAEIERLLLARPDGDQRAWEPGETLDQLRAENGLILDGGG